MEKAIYRHSTLVILLAHLIYSHASGLDLAKSLTAVFLIALHAYAKYLEKMELPNIIKELADFKVEVAKANEATDKELARKIEFFENSIAKYESFFIKNGSNVPTKTMRF